MPVAAPSIAAGAASFDYSLRISCLAAAVRVIGLLVFQR